MITAEDRDRTNLYRIRAEGLVPAVGQAADLRLFLEELQMQLTVHDRTPKEQQRALQLINKTNQFNINGRRLTELELSEIVRNGGRLYTASLVDRTGAHGEILSCLVSNQGVVEAFVLSCRVFQRRIEHAFLCWLASNGAPVAFRYAETSRNEPAQQFFRDAAFKMNAAGLLEFDAKLFLERHSADTALCGVETG